VDESLLSRKSTSASRSWRRLAKRRKSRVSSQGDGSHPPENSPENLIFPSEVRIVPIYEYRCEKCHFVMELLESYSDAAKEHRCQKCGSKDVRKLLSVPNVKATGGSCPTGTCPLT
jgi:putative FmdB family regulatory protein